MRFPFINTFSRREDGSLSVEAVLVLPILIWAMVATLVMWDAFKTLNISQKATYTVADMVSREEVEISESYLASLLEIYGFLANSDGDNALRVSVVTLVEDQNTAVQSLELLCSRGLGGIDDYDNISQIEDRIPTMALGDQLIVVESEQEWAPAFAVGLASYRFREVALARPRYAPQVLLEACP